MRLILNMHPLRIAVMALAFCAAACSPSGQSAQSTPQKKTSEPSTMSTTSTNSTAGTGTNSTTGLQKIVVGGGCFWCVEAVYQRVPGVKKVVSGYAGGHVMNPTYEQVCEKNTGHAEIVEVQFDPAQVKLESILDVFFAAHDPTTLNRQGADSGPQYRSVIFYANDEQRKAAEAAKERAKNEWPDPIVTEISPLKNHFPAEDYHQNYFNENASKNRYCSIVIVPKIKKLVEKGIIRPQSQL